MKSKYNLQVVAADPNSEVWIEREFCKMVAGAQARAEGLRAFPTLRAAIVHSAKFNAFVWEGDSVAYIAVSTGAMDALADLSYRAFACSDLLTTFGDPKVELFDSRTIPKFASSSTNLTNPDVIVPVDKHRYALAGLMWANALFFLVNHETAHILLGHDRFTRGTGLWAEFARIDVAKLSMCVDEVRNAVQVVLERQADRLAVVACFQHQQRLAGHESTAESTLVVAGGIIGWMVLADRVYPDHDLPRRTHPAPRHRYFDAVIIVDEMAKELPLGAEFRELLPNLLLDIENAVAGMTGRRRNDHEIRQSYAEFRTVKPALDNCEEMIGPFLAEFGYVNQLDKNAVRFSALYETFSQPPPKAIARWDRIAEILHKFLSLRNLYGPDTDRSFVIRLTDSVDSFEVRASSTKDTDEILVPTSVEAVLTDICHSLLKEAGAFPKVGVAGLPANVPRYAGRLPRSAAELVRLAPTPYTLGSSVDASRNQYATNLVTLALHLMVFHEFTHILHGHTRLRLARQGENLPLSQHDLDCLEAEADQYAGFMLGRFLTPCTSETFDMALHAALILHMLVTPNPKTTPSGELSSHPHPADRLRLSTDGLCHAAERRGLKWVPTFTDLAELPTWRKCLTGHEVNSTDVTTVLMEERTTIERLERWQLILRPLLEPFALIELPTAGPAVDETYDGL